MAKGEFNKFNLISNISKNKTLNKKKAILIIFITMEMLLFYPTKRKEHLGENFLNFCFELSFFYFFLLICQLQRRGEQWQSKRIYFTNKKVIIHLVKFVVILFGRCYRLSIFYRTATIKKENSDLQNETKLLIWHDATQRQEKRIKNAMRGLFWIYSPCREKQKVGISFLFNGNRNYNLKNEVEKIMLRLCCRLSFIYYLYQVQHNQLF